MPSLFNRKYDILSLKVFDVFLSMKNEQTAHRHNAALPYARTDNSRVTLINAY